MNKEKDPVQMQLRDHKKRWNLAAKEFVSRLIALKQGLNGRGSAKRGLPISDIKNPFPPEIAAFLSQLTSDFQQLAEEASGIIQEQAYYSEHRRKPQPKQPQSPEQNQFAPPKVAMASTKQAVVILGQEKFPTLLAITPEEQEKGLMFVEPPTPVMSFIYAHPMPQSFWMAKTPSQLDIVFSHRGIITSIQRGEPFSTKIIKDEIPSDLVVELPAGTCMAKNITIGDPIRLVRA